MQQSSNLPRFELELILAHVLRKPREYVLTHPEIKLSPAQVQKLNALIKRREKGEPLGFILGHKEFYGLDFYVNKNTLIPRPETELMVEKVLCLAHENRKSTIIDVGTGTGSIIITLAKLLKAYNIFCAIDISKPALDIARKNAKLNKVENRIKFMSGNLLEPIIKLKRNHDNNYIFATQNSKIIITANLPYLTPKQIKNSPSIKREPRLALTAGEDGLKYYRELFWQINEMLISNKPLSRAPRIHLFCEIDPSQKLSMRQLVKQVLPGAQVQIKKDLRGHSRLAIINF